MCVDGDKKKPDKRGDRPVSELLGEAPEKARKKGEQWVTVGDLLDRAGSRVYGLALVLLALPEGTPFLTAGLNTVFAIPLLALTAWMTVAGLQPRLPDWLRARRIKRRWVEKALARGASWLSRVERLSTLRMPGWAEAGRPLGLVCFVLTVMMLIPLPFTNVAPAWCVIVIGFGIFRHDGLLVAAGVAAGLVLIGVLAYLLLAAL